VPICKQTVGKGALNVRANPELQTQAPGLGDESCRDEFGGHSSVHARICSTLPPNPLKGRGHCTQVFDNLPCVSKYIPASQS
jgi:hypothetical protein